MPSNTLLYHHRTQNSGAEGVHIEGIQSAFRNLGFRIDDMSLVKNPPRGGTPQRCSPVRALLSLVASKLPNLAFKLVELAYNAYSFFLGAGRILRSTVQGEKPRFIYERYTYFNFGLVLAANILRVPVVLEVNTTCLDYDVREIKLRFIARGVERFVFRHATVLTVVSSYLKDKIVSTYAVDPAKILVTPNAVNPDRFVLDAEPSTATPAFAAAREFARGGFVIGFVGVFVPWHGLEFLIEVFEKIASRLGDRSPRLLLVGDGPMREIVERRVASGRLDRYVRITGLVPHEEIKEYLSLFDVAIMPDSNPFGSPMKIFEYMVMGKPIVAPRYGPIAEVIEDGVNGLLFEPNNADCCAGKLERVIGDASLRNEMARRARADVLEKHTWDRNVARIWSALSSGC